VDEFIDWLAIGIADITAVVDPEVVILDGGVARSLQPILPRVEAILAGVLPKVPRLVASTLGPNATVVGAIAAAIRLGTSQFFHPDIWEPEHPKPGRGSALSTNLLPSDETGQSGKPP